MPPWHVFSRWQGFIPARTHGKAEVMVTLRVPLGPWRDVSVVELFVKALFKAGEGRGQADTKQPSARLHL